LNYDGNVGIGTTAPGELLHIHKQATTGAVPLTLLKLVVSEDSSVNTVAGEGPAISFHVAEDGGYETYSSGLIAVVREDASDTNANAAMTFWTEAADNAATEKMRITSAGNVGIGAGSAPGNKLHVIDSGSIEWAAVISATAGNIANHALRLDAGVNSPASQGDCIYVEFREGDGGTALGGIRCGSTPANPEFFNGSDERIKKNIVDTKVKGLEVINGFGMKQFEFKKAKFAGQVTDIGFIAQNCEEVYPRMVSEHPDMSESWEMDDPVKCVSDGALIPVLVKAIQELSAKVTALENA
jgi:hypothetical protein